MDSRPREMVPVLSIGEPYECSEGYCFRDLEKCGARGRRMMRRNGLQQDAQRKGWKQDGSWKKIGPNTRLR